MTPRRRWPFVRRADAARRGKGSDELRCIDWGDVVTAAIGRGDVEARHEDDQGAREAAVETPGSRA